MPSYTIIRSKRAWTIPERQIPGDDAHFLRIAEINCSNYVKGMDIGLRNSTGPGRKTSLVEANHIGMIPPCILKSDLQEDLRTRLIPA
jgi:hypothetical protein